MAGQAVYIVLFRGVGGATQLPTKPLREALAKAGFGNVATYINSGNAILSSALRASEIAGKIAAIVKKEFAFDKDIMIVSRADWTKLIKGNPFPEAVYAPTTLHAFVLDKAPTKEAIETLTARAARHEGVVVKGKLLYFHAPEGFGTSKLPPVIDRLLGVAGTARNWRTVLALMKMADEV